MKRVLIITYYWPPSGATVTTLSACVNTSSSKR